MFISRKLSAQSLLLLSYSRQCCQLHTCQKINSSRKLSRVNAVASLHTTRTSSTQKDLQPTAKDLVPRERFFQEKEVKNKDTFLQMIDMYSRSDKVKRGHIEFIYAALKYMGEFGVLGDQEVYKRLMDVFPKGKMIPRSLIQAEFLHFGRHQECGIYLLDHMEHEGVIPDREMKEIVLASFGQSSVVYKKLARMLYWMPKLKNINPYLLPDPLPTDVRELARLALNKMCRDKRTKIEEYDAKHLEDSFDKTWIMSAQSPVQRKLIEEHPDKQALYVEGPTLVWLRKISITYFMLRADPKIYPVCEVDDDDVSNLSLHMFGEPKHAELTLTPQSMHEQEEGVVMAMCCTGTSSKDSLLSWVRFLHKTNPKLDSIPVLFKIRTSPSTVVSANAGKEAEAEVAAEALKAERTNPEEDLRP